LGNEALEGEGVARHLQKEKEIRKYYKTIDYLTSNMKDFLGKGRLKYTKAMNSTLIKAG
jgi:hypothetical protein